MPAVGLMLKPFYPLPDSLKMYQSRSSPFPWDVFCIYKTLGIERSSHNMLAQFDRHNDDIVAPAGLDPLVLNWHLV